MRVLWIVNTIFPVPAQKIGIKPSVFGGWLSSLFEGIKNNQEIDKMAIVSTYSGQQLLNFIDGNVIYYLLPSKNNKKYESKHTYYWKKIALEFKPDFVHIHGTEFPIGIECMDSIPDIKYIVSIQGLMTRCADLYYAGIGMKELITNITLRDILKRDTMFQAKRKFKRQSKYEVKMISRANYIIGRTDWDYSNTIAINQNAKYFHLNETIRNSFYLKSWDIKSIQRHSIMMSQGYYPIKGLHQMIKALYVLKRKYHDIMLYVTGENIFSISSKKDRLKISGYAKYINSLINKYHLQSNVVFLGILNEEETVRLMLRSHVLVVPSIVENESNSLSEAHLLGLPTVIAFSGGMTNRVEHKISGFCYPFSESAMLATYISNYFENDDICLTFSKNAKKNALERNNSGKNINDIMRIYQEVANEK